MQTVDGIRRLEPEPARRGGWLLPWQSQFKIARLSYVLFVLLFFSLIFVIGATSKTAARIATILPPGKYLVLFQNNSELRPSGGFIGSFATLDLTKWGPRNLRIETNIYKLDNAFTSQTRIEPPAPIATVTDRWALRDSNWDPDFRNAAQRVTQFYEKETGATVDGVVAINASVAQDLLAATGPIKLSDGQEISANTFFDVLHYKIEREYFFSSENQIVNEPKTVLRDLARRLFLRLFSPTVLPKVIALLEQEIQEKHILFWHRDTTVEALLQSKGWAGSLPDSAESFVAVVNANIGGQKSSLNVAQDASLSISRDQTGTVNLLRLRRTHRGDGIWPDGENTNYTRILLPSNAEVRQVSRNGESLPVQSVIGNEQGTQSVGLWFSAKPLETTTLEIEYVLPELVSTLKYVKQPGVLSETLQLKAFGQPVFSGQITQDMTFTLD